MIFVRQVLQKFTHLLYVKLEFHLLELEEEGQLVV
jgi:hypothetical protein